jgi:DNA-binding winged helix-turn-helix (wHTH) protein
VQSIAILRFPKVISRDNAFVAVFSATEPMEFRMGANQPFARQRLPQQITELDVSIESEAVTQTARADAGARADSQAVTTEISFGSFRLLPAQRLLLDGNKTVQLGSRAFDILIALVERPSELVSKEQLMARVWPKVFVDPANLTVHISALRRALRDGRDGNRFFVNVPGRGYVFVAPVKSYDPTKQSHAALPNVPVHNPPAHVDRLITEEPVDESSPRLSRDRLVTVAGPDRSKHQQSDRRRRPLRAGPLQRNDQATGARARSSNPKTLEPSEESWR